MVKRELLAQALVDKFIQVCFREIESGDLCIADFHCGNHSDPVYQHPDGLAQNINFLDFKLGVCITDFGEVFFCHVAPGAKP